VVAITGVAVGGKLFAPGSSAFSAVQAIGVVPGSRTMAALEAERSQLIARTTAARTLTVVAKPKLAGRGRRGHPNHRHGRRRHHLRHVHAA
jgi:hypothetical protein